MPVPVPELPNVIPAHPCPITTTIIILLITITIIIALFTKRMCSSPPSSLHTRVVSSCGRQMEVIQVVMTMMITVRLEQWSNDGMMTDKGG